MTKDVAWIFWNWQCNNHFVNNPTPTNDTMNLKRADSKVPAPASSSSVPPKKRRTSNLLGNPMSPDDCNGEPLMVRHLFKSKDKQFVPICKQKHEHLQHIMRSMEKKHDEMGIFTPHPFAVTQRLQTSNFVKNTSSAKIWTQCVWSPQSKNNH